jgi:hypothetical protein
VSDYTLDAMDNTHHVLKSGVMLDFDCRGHLALPALQEAAIFNRTQNNCTRKSHTQTKVIGSRSVCATLSCLLQSEHAISKCRAVYLGAKIPKRVTGQGYVSVRRAASAHYRRVSHCGDWGPKKHNQAVAIGRALPYTSISRIRCRSLPSSCGM